MSDEVLAIEVAAKISGRKIEPADLVTCLVHYLKKATPSGIVAMSNEIAISFYDRSRFVSGWCRLTNPEIFVGESRVYIEIRFRYGVIRIRARYAGTESPVAGRNLDRIKPALD